MPPLSGVNVPCCATRFRCRDTTNNRKLAHAKLAKVPISRIHRAHNLAATRAHVASTSIHAHDPPVLAASSPCSASLHMCCVGRRQGQLGNATLQSILFQISFRFSDYPYRDPYIAPRRASRQDRHQRSEPSLRQSRARTLPSRQGVNI